MQQKIINTLLLCLLASYATAQIGGLSSYSFLNLPASARVTALGGSLVAVKDNDVTLALENPAALNEQMHHQLSFNHNINFADIKNGYVAYSHHLNKLGGLSLQAGMQYTNYGDFKNSDIFGNINGDFKAKEYAFLLGAGKQLSERLSVGTNLKMISSRLESYQSTAIGGDVAAMYYDTNSRFAATLTFRNIGAPITTYTETDELSMPFNISFGISKRLRYLPLRLSVTAQNLQRWSIRYDSPEQNVISDFGGDTQVSRSAFQNGLDNLFRHLIFSGELLLGKREQVRLRVGYNHLRRKELSLNGYRSLAGFSGGLGFKINRFRIDYGFATYHLAGSVNHFTISTDLDDFRKKKTKVE